MIEPYADYMAKTHFKGIFGKYKNSIKLKFDIFGVSTSTVNILCIAIYLCIMNAIKDEEPKI